MVGGLWFLLALGATGLHVETDTPDALCPPLEPVRQAVRSRLGEVEGGPYEARFAVVRGGNRESDVLVLTLRGASGEELLRRELPLASLGCSDAAEVIALVLERFFQQMSGARAPSLLPDEGPSAPSAPAPDNDPDTEPADASPSAAEPTHTPDGAPSEPPSPTPGETSAAAGSAAPRPRRESTGAGADTESPPAWSLRGNASFHSTLTPGAGLGASFRATPWVQLVLDTTWPLVARTRQEQELQLSTQSSWLFGSGLFLLEGGPWSVGAGPAVGLELQQAEIEGTPELSAGRKARVLFGVGAHAVARLVVSEPLQLELGVRALPMFTGAAKEFAVADSGGRETEVLRPPGLAWTASFGLNVRLGGDP